MRIADQLDITNALTQFVEGGTRSEQQGLAVRGCRDTLRAPVEQRRAKRVFERRNGF
nr:hypothetical protein [Rhodoplanes sp. Z2-YC6860]